jgi:hypothetical protein
VLERPAPEIKTAGWDSSRDGAQVGGGGLATDTGRDRGGTERARRSPPGGGAYRLLLLNDAGAKQATVVKGIRAVIPNADEAHALNCFTTAQTLGMAIVTRRARESELRERAARRAIAADARSPRARSCRLPAKRAAASPTAPRAPPPRKQRAQGARGALPAAAVPVWDKEDQNRARQLHCVGAGLCAGPAMGRLN